MLVGFPIRQFQLCKELEKDEDIFEEKEVTKEVMIGDQLVKKTFKQKVKVGTRKSGSECLWIDEPAVPEYLKQGFKFTGEKRMSYCPPEWIAGKTNGGFLMIDDYTRAESRFLQSTMELIDRQQYISWKLPKGWNIILTSNPDNGKYHVNALDVAQRTRFVSINLKFDADCWASWAEKEMIDGRCINFLLMHPEVINDKVNPRSITTFFNCISSIKDFEKNLPLIQLIGEGSVGGEVSTLFTMFINNKLDKMISPKDILFHANEDYILGQFAGLVDLKGNYRADIASILNTRIINYILFYSEKNAVPQSVIDRLIRLSTKEEILTEDLKFVLVRKLLNGNKQKFQKLLNNSEVISMASKL